MNPLTETCLKYLDGDLTESEVKDFDRLIAESKEAAQELARHLIDEHYFAKTQSTATRGQIDASDASDASALNLAVCHLEEDQDSDRVLQELLRMEREAGILPQPHGGAMVQELNVESGSTKLTWVQATGAMNYLLEHAVKSTSARWVAAAAVLIAATLWIASGLSSDQNQSPDSAFTQTPSQAPTSTATQLAVASVTGELNAQWQSEAGNDIDKVGDDLKPGQRLTLTQGKAQITTTQGAILNLQAPCTIEMLNGGNSLKLIAGQLVGICETPSSKGLLVRTPHMDIIDLGTRFGVEVTQDNATSLHVFTGEVKASLASNETTQATQVLTEGQAIASRQGSGRFVQINQDSQRFAGLLESRLSTSQADANLPGVRSMEGDAVVASGASFIGRDAEQWPHSEDAQVFFEYEGRLSSDVNINIAEPGDFRKLINAPQSTIPQGTELASYIILKTANPSQELTKVSGSVTFEREIIGVITNDETSETFLKAVDEQSHLLVPQDSKQQWIEIYAFEEGVAISEDRRTIHFDFQVKQSSDTIRVLMKGKE